MDRVFGDKPLEILGLGRNIRGPITNVNYAAKQINRIFAARHDDP